MNVSGVVVKTTPQHINGLIEKLQKTPSVDCHFHDDLGHIIITIEAENVSSEIAILAKIQKLPHVISAEMSYSYAEEELDQERENLLAVEDPVPNVLKDDKINAKDIKYSGSVDTFLGTKRKKNDK